MADYRFSKVKLTLDGKQVELSLDTIRKKAAQTAEAMRAMQPNSKEWKEAKKNLEALHAAEEDLIPVLQRVEHYMNEMGSTATTDIGRALRELTKLRDAMPGDHKDLDRVNGFIDLFKDWQKQNRELGMTFEKAKQQLIDLTNVSPEKLRQGLEAVNKELSKTANPVKREELKGYAKRYEAEMAVKQYGKAGTADMSAMNAEQLKAEQSRLKSAYMATQGAQGYEAISEEYLQRLQEVNQLLKDIGKVDVSKVMNDLQTGNATLEQMEQALKQLKEDAANIPAWKKWDIEKNTQDIETLEKAIGDLKAQMQGIADLDFDNLEDVSTEKLEAALKRLDAEEKKLSGTQKKEAEEVALKKAKVEHQIQKNKIATQDFTQAEEVAANTGKYSVQQLQKAYDALKTKLTNLAISEKREIARTKEQMAKLKSKIDEVTGSVKNQNAIWQTAVRNITAYVGVFGAFNFIKNKVQQVFENNNKLSDSLANIRKVSGLTSEEINGLYKNIAKIDTRNSVDQLNQLAYAGAKLGVQEHGGARALLGFVKAAEQVQMALGEDLGEEALPALAKLTDVMGVIKTNGVEQAMQKAASSIFMLSTTSTSTGQNIVEMSKRLMGMGRSAHFTADELLGLASAADAFGLMPEVAATAFNKLFMSFQTKSGLIEKTLDIPQGTLNKYYEAGETMKGVLLILDKMKEAGNASRMGDAFKDLGGDGARLVYVLTTMAGKVDDLRKHLQVSNDAFRDGEAVIAEYMIQNQTAAAYMERAANLWEKAFTNPEGVDAVSDFAKQWHEVSKELTQSTLMMGSMKTALYLVIETVKILIKLLPTLISFFLFKGALTSITMVGQGFWNMSKAIWAAVTATKALTAAQKWNGITTAISLLAAALWTVKSAMNEAAEAAERERERHAELQKSFAKSKEAVEESVKPLEDYKKALDDANLSEEQKKKLVKDFVNQYQDYLDYLGLEIKSVDELAKAYGRVVEIMKIKKAYDERENYRSEVNNENKMNRIANQAEVIREAQKLGVKIDKQYLEKNQHLGTKGVYDKIMRQTYGMGAFEVKGTGRGRWAMRDSKGKIKEVGSEELWDAINGYITSFRSERQTNKEVDRMFNAEYKGLENFDIEKWNKKIFQAQLKRDKSLVTKPESDKKKKKELKDQFKDAKTAAEGVIAKIDEWYNLQIAAVKEMRANGEMTEDEMKDVLNYLEIERNNALEKGRRAVASGTKQEMDEWKRYASEEMPKLMADAGEWSTKLLDAIQKVDIDALHALLKQFNGKGIYKDLDSTSFLDSILKKAAENKSKHNELQAKLTEQIDKMLKQYLYVQKAQEQMMADLQDIGFRTETPEQILERSRKGITKKPDTMIGIRTSQREEMVSSYMQRYGTETPVTDTENVEQLQQWLSDFTEQGKAKWAIGLPSISAWLKDANSHLPEIKKFYETLQGIQLTAEQRQREGGGKSIEQTTTVQENKTFDTLLGRTITDKEAYNTLGTKFRAQKTLPFTIDIENEQEAMEWIKKFATNARGEMEDWVQAFPDLIYWLDLLKKREDALKSGDLIGAKKVQQEIDEAQPKIKSFYYTMMKGEEDYQNAIKKKRDEFSKTNKTRWQTSGNEEYFTQREKQFQGVANEQERRPSVARDLGFQNLMDDGEINMYATKLVEAQAYYDQLAVMKQNNADLDAVLADQEAEIMKQRMALQDKLMEKMNEQAQSFEKLSAPLEDYAETVGNALGRMTEDGYSFSEAMKQANLKVLESFGKLTIDLIKEQITQRIRRLAVQKATDKLMLREQQTHQDVMLAEEQTADERRVVIKEAGGQAMALVEKITGQQIETTQAATNQTTEAAEMADTTAKTNMGIVKGEAKTIGELGWWGIPLAAAIGILLNGLLSWLLGSLGKSNDNETPTTQSSSNATKTKLVSGMLTYDRGNIGSVFGGRRKIYDDGTTQVYDTDRQEKREKRRHPVIGQDGQVYMVHDEPELRTGIVRQPTATMVNGEPAIVGEKGPEIVIGRKTSAAIQKNAPELLQAIADIDRNPNHRPALPVYEKGNVQESVVREMMDNFHKTHTVNNTENTESMTRWFNDFVTTAVVDENGMPKRQQAEFMKAMPQMEQWLRDPESHQKEITQFYTTLATYDERITKESTYKAVPAATPQGVQLITQPIATTINGEPSLVAEKGPEIVIGRETSKAIMMNEPELLQRIVKYDKHGGRAGLTAMRAFDQGNVSTVVPDEVGDVAQPVATPDAPVTSDNSDLRQTMQEMQQVMQGVLYYLKHPVSPEIAMYGENGLHKKMKQADKFMSKYEG